MNDDFANAQLITGPTGSVYGTNVGATLQPNEPLHGSDAGGHSIWYQWTAPVSGEVTFEINGDGFAPQLAIYTGNSLNALNRVATASDSGRINRVTFRITQNVLYRIAVDGRNGGVGRTLLRWKVKAGPTNDDFINAKVFATNSGALPGDNTLATKEAGEPQHTPDFADNSIWYRWTAPGDGVFAVLAQGRFNVAVVPYTGSSVSALTPVTPVLSDDKPGTSRRDWQVRAGTTYNIAIIGRTTAGVPAGGLVLVRWRFTPGLTTNVPNPPPSNNGFVTPSTASATAPSVNVNVSFSTSTDASRFSASLSDGGNVLLNGVGFPVQNILLKGTTVTIQLFTDQLHTGDQVQINSKLLKQPLIVTVA